MHQDPVGIVLDIWKVSILLSTAWLLTFWCVSVLEFNIWITCNNNNNNITTKIIRYNSRCSEHSGCLNSNPAQGGVGQATGQFEAEVWRGKIQLMKKKWVKMGFCFRQYTCCLNLSRWKLVHASAGYGALLTSCKGGAEWSFLWRYVHLVTLTTAQGNLCKNTWKFPEKAKFLDQSGMTSNERCRSTCWRTIFIVSAQVTNVMAFLVIQVQFHVHVSSDVFAFSCQVLSLGYAARARHWVQNQL